jgi:hypothetical protein
MGGRQMAFQELVLFGPTERSINLCTRLNNPVKNTIELPPGRKEIDKFNAIMKKHSRWVVRVPPVGGYNCVGHVWASRRTAVHEETEINLIFRDDGYRVVEQNEQVGVGDFVAYFHQLERQLGFLHVGLVIEMREAQGVQMKVPFVLSKWDGASGEVIHHFMDVPFESDVHQFWTERPMLMGATR